MSYKEDRQQSLSWSIHKLSSYMKCGQDFALGTTHEFVALRSLQFPRNALPGIYSKLFPFLLTLL